jgi:Ser/Thr protein kinase RdoA (MazF antagonist)
MHNIDDTEHILQVLNRSYSLVFDRLTFLRDSGSRSFQAHTGNEMYFLRVTKPAFADTALQSIDVHVYLQNQGFPVPQIVFTLDNTPNIERCDETGTILLVLYEYMEGQEVDPIQDPKRSGI